MKKNQLFIYIVFILFQIQCKSTQKQITYSSDTLQILPASPNSFIHISYLNTDDFGRVACNGLLFINDGEVAIFDTPTNETATAELLDWIQNDLKCTVSAVVINHFHEDCLGGLNTFSKQGIPSFASAKTITLAKEQGWPIPEIAFENSMEIEIGSSKIMNKFFGEAHTKDNIVSYIPDENLLFAGCMVKSIGATKGYLGDANTHTWSKTISKVKEAYPDLKFVIPGHEKHGGSELLDYTIDLFKKQ
ncbi:subclass B1 metallo-beta-lactamase [Costertonia aggregata]|uniref:beta-lactamase n=1 Tax=Costertonia aggregata TaxID=343403 RepID=A0A7H9ALR5_9FLAO|nr:subclass B1 metallo-beta-lactamase [Costertonia aggregata]QLG44406.1 subclass B1 metallo-beta-lactamase [Costertonia aggregata]